MDDPPQRYLLISGYSPGSSGRYASSGEMVASCLW